MGVNDIQLAKFLGCFSIGLGAIELLAPRHLIRLLGLPRSPALVRAFGAREVAAGAAVLTYPDNPAPLWARLGGDALDLAVLGSRCGQAGAGGSRLRRPLPLPSWR